MVSDTRIGLHDVVLHADTFVSLVHPDIHTPNRKTFVIVWSDNLKNSTAQIVHCLSLTSQSSNGSQSRPFFGCILLVRAQFFDNNICFEFITERKFQWVYHILGVINYFSPSLLSLSLFYLSLSLALFELYW